MLDGLSPRPRGVIFDYGNTLIPFGAREMAAEGETIARFVLGEIPGTEAGRARAAIMEARVELHRRRMEDLVETEPADVIRLAFAALGASCDDGQVERGLEAMHDGFVSAIVPGDGAEEVLRELKARGYRVGLLSNYSNGDAIRTSLAKIGFEAWLDDVLVSADVGIVKPHPEIFAEGARRLDLPPEEILFVGDNLRADIAGASGVGMRTAHITQHLKGAYHFEHKDENVVDVRPDIVLEHITDLLQEA